MHSIIKEMMVSIIHESRTIVIYIRDNKICFHRIDSVALKPIEGPAGKALQTFQHVDRFSRKLQRRLTRRTLAEAKALKEHGAEAIHVLIYVVELVILNNYIIESQIIHLISNLDCN